tara:strand:- start:486 stop:596 length:111 start_codon:yes stop_codon:yes gene_type:complete
MKFDISKTLLWHFQNFTMGFSKLYYGIFKTLLWEFE